MKRNWGFQTSVINGTLKRFSFPKGILELEQTSIPTGKYAVMTLLHNSSESPPLSDIEISDIEASNREYEEGTMEIFDNIEEFFEAMRELRDTDER